MALHQSSLKHQFNDGLKLSSKIEQLRSCPAHSVQGIGLPDDCRAGF